MTGVGERCQFDGQEADGTCGGAAVIAVVVGCVHEHLIILSACQYHVEDVAHDEADCQPCLDAGEPSCAVALVGEFSGDGHA